MENNEIFSKWGFPLNLQSNIFGAEIPAYYEDTAKYKGSKIYLITL